MIDVFSDLDSLGLTPVSYIVGSGPAGNPHVPRIPTTSFSVALNGAITHDYPFHAWAIWSANAIDQHWFQRYREERPQCKIICGIELAESGALPWEPDYTFQYLPLYFPGVGMKDGICKGGMTIAGSMVQLFALSKRVSHIVCCGIDMRGRFHHDGSPSFEPEHHWGQAMLFNYLIDETQDRGIHVSTLSPTFLHLPETPCAPE